MKSIIIAAVACFALTAQAHAMSDAECTSLWKIADSNSDGTLTGVEGERYLALLRIANQTVDANGTLTETRFQESCKTDIFKLAASEPGAPLAGANSFTEDQARDRVVANGFATPSAMTKDENGIWRGTSLKEGKSITIAVDYKGNVVAQ
jgi:hypothetical protein